MAEEVASQLDTTVFQVKIRRGVGVAMAPAHGQSVLTYQPGSKSAQDLQFVVDTVAGDKFSSGKRNWDLFGGWLSRR